MIYRLIKHFKYRYRQYLLPLICFITISYGAMFLYGLSKTNASLQTLVKKDLQYEISISERLFSTTDLQNVVSKSESYFNEYREIRDILIQNTADFSAISTVYTKDIVINKYAKPDDDFSFTAVTLYGIEEDFLKDNNIPLIEGRSIQNDGEIIVNKNTRYFKDGELFAPVIGDTIELYLQKAFDASGAIYYPQPLIFKVVGIYDERRIDVLKANKQDYLLNSRFYVSRNDAIYLLEDWFSLFTQSNASLLDVTIPSLSFNDASFRFESSEECEKAYPKIKRLFSGYGEEDENYYKVSSNLDEVNAILLPFQSLQATSKNYAGLFLIVICCLMALFITLSAIKNKKEQAIKMTMGLRYFDNLIETLIAYIFILIVGFIIGIIAYHFSYELIITGILKDSIDLQNELLRIASGDIYAFNRYLDLSSIEDVNIPLAYSIITLGSAVVLLSLMIWIIYHCIQPKNIKKALFE